ncbi:unnamed protein product [Spirodela intermedia]|uniref:DUF3730 domain-containing protein n=1 Tax=Spirodela intermedia TaxID=51605 RepID=A0A7I8IT57_SPIIN|nr:unnamed protein product [Spirodela intermedia]CAA6661192.1 unnamed protein product [Spirodela intermedia]
MSLLLSAVASIFIFHPQLMSLAVDSLSSLASMDPKFSMTLLLGICFTLKYSALQEITQQKNWYALKILEMLPLLASSSAMVPLILQILMPMLQEDAKPEAGGATVLRGVLYAMAVRLLCKTWIVTDRVFGTLQRDICLSIAASIRDVCRHNPDRGVDLILSVSSCIESRDSSVQALGFEAIAYLSEADVIDFYTAWSIIEKHMLDYSEDPVVALGLCTLVRWGAMDAEANPEAAMKVILIEHILKAIPDFLKRSLEFLVSEDNPEIRKAMEDLVVRIINFEHINRRRAVKERKAMTHKVEKLLDIFPRAMFSSGKWETKISVGELPGAALLSVSFTSKTCKDISKLHGKYEAMLLEVAESLQLARNICVALLAFQSWKSFINCWLSAVTVTGASPNASDESSKSASMVLKILLRLAEKSIPRVAENIALAIGALCFAASEYTVLSDASSFLLKWLFQYEHEHQQWSAAISLGLVSNSLHITDKSRKVDIIHGLLEVSQNSRSCLVKGACGAGLGFTCQNLFTQVNDDSEGRVTEAKLLGKIIHSLSLTIRQMCPSSSDSMMHLRRSFPLDEDEAQADVLTDLLSYSYEDVSDSWGATGLVLGLGNTVVALYRLGAFDGIKSIKNILLSWITYCDFSSQGSQDEVFEIPLSIGSCLVLPTVVHFCERAEMTDIDLPGFWAAHRNLLMASSIGAGSLLSYILNEGVHSLKFDDIRCLLENMRSLYTQSYPPIVQLGGMLGVVNAFGAGAVTLTEKFLRPSLGIDDVSKDSLYIRGPISANPALEPLSTSLIQEMFVIAKESTDKQIRRYAAWSVSFLRHWWLSLDSQSVQESRSVSENTLMNDFPNVKTVASVLRCLSQAPRLPGSADWGAIIKRCMRYGAQSSAKSKMTAQEPNTIREECIRLSLAHASSDSSLMLFVDELAIGSRFSTLELNLQCLLLSQLSEIMGVFSASRFEKLYGDLVEWLSSSATYLLYSAYEKSLLRISFWKGLHQCLVKASDKSAGALQVEKCIELLFSLLPVSISDHELTEAVSCLSVAPQDWLMNVLQVRKINAIGEGNHDAEAVKKVIITARLVKKGCLPASELGKLKTFILSSESEGIWIVLLEVVGALYGADSSIKGQWLLDAIEISCISRHPTTALQFVGILSGRCCDYMPLLILSPEAVLSDLPVTLPSLLSSSKAKTAAHSCWAIQCGRPASRLNITCHLRRG